MRPDAGRQINLSRSSESTIQNRLRTTLADQGTLPPFFSLNGYRQRKNICADDLSSARSAAA